MLTSRMDGVVVISHSIPLTLKHSSKINPSSRYPANSSQVTERAEQQINVHEAWSTEAIIVFSVGVILAMYVMVLIAVVCKYQRKIQQENRLADLHNAFLFKEQCLLQSGKESEVNSLEEEEALIKLHGPDQCNV